MPRRGRDRTSTGRPAGWSSRTSSSLGRDCWWRRLHCRSVGCPAQLGITAPVASNHMSGTSCVLSPRCWAARLTDRDSPLVRRAVADPGSGAAMEVKRGAVLRVRRPRSHVRGVGGDEEVAPGSRGKQVHEDYAHRPVLLGDDRRSQVRRPDSARSARRAGELAIAPQCRRGQVRDASCEEYCTSPIT